MLIAIPSKGRAGLTTTDKYFPNLGTFFIPESEYHQYKGLVKNIVCIPKEVQGITPTRNWILKNTTERHVVMLDDDVKSAGYVRRYERNVKHVKIKDEGFWAEEFLRYFEMTEQLDFKLWGMRTESSTKGAVPQKPIITKCYVLGSCMGIVNDGEYYFDESFKVKEDYELCLRNIKENGGVLGIRYAYWENFHYTTDGGCKDYRTIDMEREAIKKLIKLYPGMIRSAKRKSSEFTIQLNL